LHESPLSLPVVVQPAVIKRLPGPDNEHLLACAGILWGGEVFINQSVNLTSRIATTVTVYAEQGFRKWCCCCTESKQC